MNSQDARAALIRYRPGTSDEADTETVAALAQAKADPALAKWLEQQVAFHAAVRGPLRETPVPEGLRERILAGPHRRKVIAVWWRSPALLAAAASLVLLLGLAAYWLAPREDDRFTNFRERMAGVARRGYQMDLVSTNQAEVRQYLAQRGPTGGYALPAGLARVSLLGCRAFHWHDRPVAMLCFQRETGDLLWLFVVNRTSVVAPPASAEPELQPVGKLMTASWTEGSITYVLGVVGDANLLKKYL